MRALRTFTTTPGTDGSPAGARCAATGGMKLHTCLGEAGQPQPSASGPWPDVPHGPGDGGTMAKEAVFVMRRHRSEELERMNEAHPFIDYANLPAPRDGIVVTTFITVRSVARSRAFYRDVLEGTVVLEENPCMVKLANSWIIMNPGGPPTPDKPDVSVVNYEAGDTTSIFMNLRVADIDDCYRKWSERGAQFLTPPIDRGAEIRCYMRDPDGYLIEVGQSTGLLSGHLAAKRPEDLPG
jgi:predicted enzyme related to lactoylglutathione lyase